MTDSSGADYSACVFSTNIKSIIFGFNMTYGLLYYYELKNYEIKYFVLNETSVSSFSIDNTTFVSKMNNNYKTKIRS
jgi:hypothetical protein